MKNLKKKLGKTGGFTLVEMLIVVAIIAILIAVSIPLVSDALDQARKNTDAANERSAKAEGAIVYMMGDTTLGIKPGQEFDLYYDANTGKLSNTSPTSDYAQHKDHETEKYIEVKIINGEVVTDWVASVSSPNPSPSP